MGHVQRDAEGFVIGLEVPEDEFCVYGTVCSHSRETSIEYTG